MSRHTPTRRAFVRDGLLCLGAFAGISSQAEDTGRKPLLRIGLVTDLHYADKPEAGTRFYRETAGKLREAVEAFNTEAVDAVVSLGDFIDQAPEVDQEIAWLRTIEKIFAGAKAERHYVLGNHCVGTLTKTEFVENTAAAKTPHYSFDRQGIHFVVLDACFRGDGVPYSRKNFEWTDANIPAHESEWLKTDLEKSTGPVVVLAHQRLDDAGKHGVRNATGIRGLLEKSGRVVGVFQGHSHKNDYQQIAGIHYCTLVAMVEGTGAESSGYAVMEVMADTSIRVRGFRRQANRELIKA
jgi:predicted phosphodiesterase